VFAGGRFDHLGRSWRHDDLMTLVGERVVVREPLFGDRGRLYVFDESDRVHLCEAEPEQSFAWGDPTGAGEQARRKAMLGRKLRGIAAQADPVDPLLAAAATAAEFGYEPLIPGGQAMEAVPERPRRKKGPSSLELWAEEARKAG
jgi:hypothetical protein